VPAAGNVARMKEALEAKGAGPYVALTWRAGMESAGPSRTQLKTIDPALLGEALRGIPATWVSVQRMPRDGEREALARSLGAPVHDFSACNDALEDMLALLSLAQRYVGVSNANTYLGAGLGLPMEVLVAHPPEWRWRDAGSISPWFPTARLFRQEAGASWREALGALRAALT